MHLARCGQGRSESSAIFSSPQAHEHSYLPHVRRATHRGAPADSRTQSVRGRVDGFERVRFIRGASLARAEACRSAARTPPGADACMTAMPGHSHLVARRAARAGPSSIWPFIGELATGAHVHTGQIDLRSVVWRGWGAPGRAGTPASGSRSPNRCRITLDFQANHRWGRRSPSARPP